MSKEKFHSPFFVRGFRWFFGPLLFLQTTGRPFKKPWGEFIQIRGIHHGVGQFLRGRWPVSEGGKLIDKIVQTAAGSRLEKSFGVLVYGRQTAEIFFGFSSPRQAMAAPTAQTAAAIHAVAGAERTSSRRPEMRLASTPPMVVMLKARLCPLAASS